MRLWPLMAGLALAGCVAPVPYPQQSSPDPMPEPASYGTPATLPPEQAARNFLTVVQRVEPVAEAYCRDVGRAENCDFRIVIDDRPGQPANAFQTLDKQGRPILAFTLALIADARNADEVAFVLGHEAAHHISGHIPKAQRSAATGAILAGVLAAASGMGDAGIEQAQQIGAGMAARGYSKEFELQADALGTEIAFHAGYDPLRGAAFFDRLPDPGDQFLGTHPANAQRKATVAGVMAELR
jgi:predicted Zn-dependent protease